MTHDPDDMNIYGVVGRGPLRRDHAYSSLGTLHGMNMGKGWVRTTTHPECPHHSKCQGYTAAYRKGLPAWSNPYCPIHRTKGCPE